MARGGALSNRLAKRVGICAVFLVAVGLAAESILFPRTSHSPMLPQGPVYLGCRVDVDFQPLFESNAARSPAHCLTVCNSSSLAALASGRCYCGPSQITKRAQILSSSTLDGQLLPGKSVPEEKCSHKCGGQRCGGFFESSVYTWGPVAPAARSIHVVICSEGPRLVGMMALVNSIRSNTNASLHFHLVTMEADAPALQRWAQRVFPELTIEVIVFNASWVEGRIRIFTHRKGLGRPLNYARNFLPQLLPQVEDRVVFIDDDTIVQGDIEDLNDTPLRPGELIAASGDCNPLHTRLKLWHNFYGSFLNYDNPTVIALGISNSTCSFNAGVFVADLAAWRAVDVSSQLNYWMELNTKEVVYGKGRPGGGSQPPFLIVFYNRRGELDPMWHVRHLGTHFAMKIPDDVLKNAKLLHWNGASKPWQPDGIKRFIPIFSRYEVSS